VKKNIVIVCLLLLVGVVSCSKAKELGKYKEQATALAATYAPKLADLAKKLPELLGHAKSLPVNLPGVSKVTSLLEENKGALDKLQGLLGNLPKDVAAKPGDAKATLDAAEKELSTGVKKLEDTTAAAQTQLDELDKAKAAAPAEGSAAAG
jgi:hypothetical protein